jgi:hypothetical protein
MSRRQRIFGIVLLAAAGCSWLDKSSPTPSVPLEFQILKTSADDYAVSGATDGTNTLVATLVASTPSAAAAAQLVSDSAALGSVIPLGGNYGDIGAVAYDGAKFLVVNQVGAVANGSNLWGQFVTTSGVASNAQFQITGSGNGPSVWSLTYGGGTYLLTYGRLEFDAGVGDSVFMAFARTISPAGVVGAELTIGTKGQISASAFDGTNFLVVYPIGGTSPQLRGRFVSTAGVLGNDIELSPVGTNVSTPVAVTYNTSAGNYGVVWGTRLSGLDANALKVAVVNAAGTSVSTGLNLMLETAVARVTSVIPNGTGFQTVWVEKDIDGNGTVRSQFVTSAGAPFLSSATLFQPDGTTTSVTASLIRLSSAKALAIVSRRVAGQRDVYGRVLSLSPPT